MTDDANDVEIGRISAFRGVIRDLIILVPLLITLCASVGGLFQSCQNNKGIEQHSQQLGELKTAVDDKAATIDKTAANVKDIKAALPDKP